MFSPKREKGRKEYLDVGSDDAYLQVARDLEVICRTFKRYEAAMARIEPLLMKLFHERDGHVFTVMELGGGLGGFAEFFMRQMDQQGIPVNYIFTEVNPLGRQEALKRLALQDGRIQVLELDACDISAREDDSVDLVLCNFMLHHIVEERDVVHLFRGAARIGRGFFFYDSERCWRAIAGTWFNLHFLPVVRVLPPMARETCYDGVLSQKRAFTIPELQAMATEAGLEVEIGRILPWELYVSWAGRRV